MLLLPGKTLKIFFISYGNSQFKVNFEIKTPSNYPENTVVLELKANPFEAKEKNTPLGYKWVP